MYMILYYDSHIREVVLKRWEEEHKQTSESSVGVNILEGDIEPHESYTLKDAKIPIGYKHTVALELYENESVEVKTEVRLQREAWNGDGRTVRSQDPEERLSLVREYQK